MLVGPGQIRVRNLKFATYLKFAICGITNKLNEFEVGFVECIVKLKLFEPKNTKFKTKHHFFTELIKVFTGGEFYIPGKF